MTSISLNDPRPASARGWGPGWPTNNASKMRRVVWSNGSGPFPSVRAEVAALIWLLGNETIRRGYVLKTPGCWGFADRAIAGTTIPSNHSWGLAVDLNAPNNPQHTPLHTDMPSWMPLLWNQYGFRWGGDYQHATKDPMHYEFMGTPTQAVEQTSKAKVNFAKPVPPPMPTPYQGDEMFMYLRATGPSSGRAVLVEGGRQCVFVDPSHANAFSSAGVPYANTPSGAMDAIYDKAYGAPVT